MYPLAHVLQRASRLFPTSLAVIDGPHRVTYRDFTRRVHRLAGALVKLGLRRGDRVAILDHNSQRYLEAYYACAHAGLVFMPVNSRLSSRELRYVLQDSDARAILLSDSFLLVYEEIKAEAPGLAFAIGMGLQKSPSGLLDYERLINAADAMTEPAAVELDETALIYYTSGTTGEPKGVCLSHRNMFAGGLDGVFACNITCDDVWLHAGPLFHLATCFAVWSMPLMGAAQAVIRFEPAQTIEFMARERITMTSLPGAILGMVADLPETRMSDLSALRTIIYGGAPTPLGVLHKAGAALPPALTHAYGITETAGFVSVLRPREHVFEGSADVLRRTTSAGQTVPLLDVRIVNDEGQDVPNGDIGEIICGGPKIMSGYWRKAEQTQAALRNGWYHTGDMGFLDGDHYLTVVDRKKDMIITGGENVYSVEVESILSTHPDVAEVAIIGVPDARWGEAVMAIVVARGNQPSPDDLIAFCRGKIAGYKIPRSIEFRDEPLPKTGPGKIAKRMLRDPYWRGTGRII